MASVEEKVANLRESLAARKANALIKAGKLKSLHSEPANPQDKLRSILNNIRIEFALNGVQPAEIPPHISVSASLPRIADKEDLSIA